MKNPIVLRLVWTCLAAGLYGLAALPQLADFADSLRECATFLAGGAWLRRPGDRA